VSNVHPFPKERFSDSELVAAVAQGDHAALEIIWNRYSSAVRSTLFSALGPDHSIEDLIQEVFISFFRCAGRVQNPSALKSLSPGFCCSHCRLRTTHKRQAFKVAQHFQGKRFGFR